MSVEEYFNGLLAFERPAEVIGEARGFVQELLIPQLNDIGGSAVRESGMAEVIKFFGEAVLHAPLDWVGFRWQAEMQGESSQFDVQAKCIILDPDPQGLPNGVERGNFIMSYLLDQCCTVVLLSLCHGECGNVEHEAQRGNERARQHLTYLARTAVTEERLFQAVSTMPQQPT